MTFGTRWITAGLAALSLGAGPAMAMNDEDVAGALGMLWRVREGACPTIGLDADAFAARAASRVMTAAELRKLYPEAFTQGYAVAGEWAGGGPDAYCKAVRQLFDGKTDFFGNAKTVPEAPAPGLTFRE